GDATILNQLPYQDVDILLVQPDYCRKNHLESAADLGHVGTAGSRVTFAARHAAEGSLRRVRRAGGRYGPIKADFKRVAAADAPGSRTIKARSAPTGTVRSRPAHAWAPRYSLQRTGGNHPLCHRHRRGGRTPT